MRYPQRGEVWLVDLGLAAKVRPCVAVSVEIGDIDRALVTLVPHTTSTRGTRYEAVVPVPFLKAGAFDAQEVVTVPPSLAYANSVTYVPMRGTRPNRFAAWLICRSTPASRTSFANPMRAWVSRRRALT